MRLKIEEIILILFLFGTLYVGGYTLYQINTTDFKSIIMGVSK